MLNSLMAHGQLQYMCWSGYSAKEQIKKKHLSDVSTENCSFHKIFGSTMLLDACKFERTRTKRSSQRHSREGTRSAQHQALQSA